VACEFALSKSKTIDPDLVVCVFSRRGETSRLVTSVTERHNVLPMMLDSLIHGTVLP